MSFFEPGHRSKLPVLLDHLSAWREAGRGGTPHFSLWSGTEAAKVSRELEVTGFVARLVTTDPLLAPAPGAAGTRKLLSN